MQVEHPIEIGPKQNLQADFYSLLQLHLPHGIYCSIAGTLIVWLNPPEVAFTVTVNLPVTVCCSTSELMLAES